MIASTIFAFIIILRVSIVVVLLTLLNDAFHNLVYGNIQSLNIASTAFKDDRNCSVELFEFVHKIVYLFFILFCALLIRCKSVKNKKLRLYIKW